MACQVRRCVSSATVRACTHKCAVRLCSMQHAARGPGRRLCRCARCAKQATLPPWVAVWRKSRGDSRHGGLKWVKRCTTAAAAGGGREGQPKNGCCKEGLLLILRLIFFFLFFYFSFFSFSFLLFFFYCNCFDNLISKQSFSNSMQIYAASHRRGLLRTMKFLFTPNFLLGSIARARYVFSYLGIWRDLVSLVGLGIIRISGALNCTTLPIRHVDTSHITMWSRPPRTPVRWSLPLPVMFTFGFSPFITATPSTTHKTPRSSAHVVLASSSSITAWTPLRLEALHKGIY